MDPKKIIIHTIVTEKMLMDRNLKVLWIEFSGKGSH